MAILDARSVGVPPLSASDTAAELPREGLPLRKYKEAPNDQAELSAGVSASRAGRISNDPSFDRSFLRLPRKRYW
jgi:hypothetical protein